MVYGSTNFCFFATSHSTLILALKERRYSWAGGIGCCSVVGGGGDGCGGGGNDCCCGGGSRDISGSRVVVILIVGVHLLD